MMSALRTSARFAACSDRGSLRHRASSAVSRERDATVRALRLVLRGATVSVGKSIRVYLADGTPGGLLTAEIMNWTGHVVAAPRS